jgi:hypothetical protein
MKSRRSALPLPRYTLPKPLKGGGRAYYFQRTNMGAQEGLHDPQRSTGHGLRCRRPAGRKGSPARVR